MTRKERMEKKEEKKEKKAIKRLTRLITVIFMLACSFLIFNILLLGPIDPILRYLIISIIVVFMLKTTVYRSLVIDKNKFKIGLFNISRVLITIIILIISTYLFMIYNSVSSFNKGNNKSTTGNINKPFTVLLMGVDSTSNKLDKKTVGNSDSLMVVSYNPKTLNATMLSIPRDSYVKLACTGKKTKITHAGWKGEECVEETIEDFLDINIDYYVKVNFKALVRIVDTMGGIEVEVPKDLCTDSSSRKGKVCIKKGKQTLNGEEALVLSRNRKQLANGDIDRGLNQQLVIKAIMNKAGKTITSTSKMRSMLDAISDNIDTNFTTNEILSFYNVGKSILKKSNKSVTDSLNIHTLYLSGEGKYLYDESANLNLYNYILYNESIEEVSNAINTNLGKRNAKMIKTFSWSIDDNYTSTPIGKRDSGTISEIDEKNKKIENDTREIIILPDFKGQNKDYVNDWCNKNNIYVSFVYQNSTSVDTDIVLEQNISAGTDIKTISSLTITLAKKENNEIVDDSEEANNNDEEINNNTN